LTELIAALRTSFLLFSMVDMVNRPGGDKPAANHPPDGDARPTGDRLARRRVGLRDERLARPPSEPRRPEQLPGDEAAYPAGRLAR